MNRSRLRPLLVLAVLAVLAAACGEDEPTTEGEAPDAQAAGDEFCNSVVEAKAATIAASQGGDPDEAIDLLEQAEQSAPEDISEQITTVVDSARGALESEDESVFESDEFRETDEEIDQYVADNCGFERVDVQGVDYAFEGLPATLPAGKVTFDFSNEGDKVHEMTVLRIKDEGLTIEELVKLPEQQAFKKIEFAGGAFAPPGEGEVENLALEPGEYGVVCFIPTGATDLEALEKAEGPPHALEGMVAQFTVE